MPYVIASIQSNFTAFDWIVVAVYLIAIVAIGVYVNRYVGSMEDYIVAGRSLRSYVSIATMVGSELGLVTIMYAAQKGFTGGLAAFHIGVVAGVVTLIVGLTGFIVVPLRQLGVMTIPEYYERRFGRGVRVFGGILLAGAGILNMGMFLKAGAIFVGGLTGLIEPNAINAIMTILLVLVLVYTILGGMVSVVITDYLQFVILSLALLVTCGLAIAKLGWTSIVKTVETVHGEPGFNPFHGEGFGPSYFVWMIFVAGIVSCAVWQTSVMRACAAESTAVVKRLYTWASVGFLIRFLIPQFLGVCALTYLWQSAELHDAFFKPDGSIVDSAEQTLKALPVFLSQIVPAGLIGLVGAGTLAAFMSTHDSYLLCWASVLAHDVARPLLGDRLSTRQELSLARLFIFLIGAFLLVWSLWYPIGQDLWDYMAVTGAVYFTGAFALLVLGLYWKRASSFGAYLALTTGSLAVLGLGSVRFGLRELGLGPVLRMLQIEDGRVSGEVISARVGLATVTLAVVLMVVGSLIRPEVRRDDGNETPPEE